MARRINPTIAALVAVSPYQQRVDGKKITARCIYCGFECDPQARPRPRVRDHSLDCAWAAGKESVGEGHQ